MTTPLSDLADRCSEALGMMGDLWTGAPLLGSRAARVTRLRELLGCPPDLRVHEVSAAMAVLYLTTIVSEKKVEEFVIPALSAPSRTAGTDTFCRPVETYGDAVQALLAGDAVVITGDVPGGLAAPASQWPTRAPNEPSAEIISRGPHTGFIERLDTNVALVRMGVRDQRLRYETFQASTRSGTQGALLYLQGLASPTVLGEVRAALARSRPSVATDASMLIEHIAPRARLFPTVGSTERPDVAWAAMLEGRVVLLTDGSPTALLIPQVFAHLLAVPDDYYKPALAATVERTLRLMGLLVTLLISAVYVAMTTFNQELSPTPFFLSISQARLGVPLPLVGEIVGLELLVEMIRQAGLRLPSSFGQSISVVGAVVIGQSAILAGFLSAPAVVVVAVSFISSFIVPSQTTAMTLRILRFPLIIAAWAFGLFGLVWCLMLVLIYLSSARSFGVPYLAPVVPLRVRGLQDTVVRRTLTSLRRSFVARPTAAAESP